MFETFFEANSNSNIAIVIDKFEDLVLNFLSDLNMRKCHETNSYVVVMKKNWKLHIWRNNFYTLGILLL